MAPKIGRRPILVPTKIEARRASILGQRPKILARSPRLAQRANLGFYPRFWGLWPQNLGPKAQDRSTCAPIFGPKGQRCGANVIWPVGPYYLRSPNFALRAKLGAIAPNFGPLAQRLGLRPNHGHLSYCHFSSKNNTNACK